MSSAKSPKMKGISVRWLLVVTTSFIVILTIAPTMQKYFAQRAQINAIQNQISDANNALEAAKRDLAKWNDPNYIATQARTRLHFIFPGERQYAITDLPDNSTTTQKPAGEVSNQIPVGLPWYEKLMASITQTNIGK